MANFGLDSKLWEARMRRTKTAQMRCFRTSAKGLLVKRVSPQYFGTLVSRRLVAMSFQARFWNSRSL
ncbi:hypothetical protein ASC80_10190 [Afipia sp. Root123D2]|nr:hypothetical protein ASC80_10190 [Afipia sp. Root123D2]